MKKKTDKNESKKQNTNIRDSWVNTDSKARTIWLDFFFTIHLFTCAYIVWVISPSSLHPLPLPPPLSLSGRTCSALFSSSVEEQK
jgi:hypothetical protein